ncbi:kinase-like domain-containing protein [Aspergillus filifer]
MSMFRSPAEIDSSDSDSSSGSSDNGVTYEEKTSRGAEESLGNAEQPPRLEDEESTEGSDIKALLDADTESHSNLMTAALLEFYCLTRAADLLNRQHGSHKRYTRESPEVQFLGKKMYAHKSKFLSAHGVIAEGIDSDKWGSTRQYYRDNLDALGLSALEGLDIGDKKRQPAPIEATSDLVIASKTTRNTTELRLKGPTVGPLDLRGLPGAQHVSALEEFQLDPSRIPRPLIPLTGSSPTSFPLFDRAPSNQTMSRYAVEFTEIRTVGRGSFGEVYHVKNHIDGQDYAVKKIPLSQRRLEQLQCGNENQLENIMKEIRTLARLEHANVVRYYGAWIEQTHVSRVPFLGQQPPVKLEYEQTHDSEPDELSQPSGDASFGVVFEHSQESQVASTVDDSIDSQSTHGNTTKSRSSEKPLSSSVEDDVESIPRNFSDQTYSQLSTFGASDGDIFTDGLSHDRSQMQLQRRYRNGDALPAVVLHIQMSLHPIPLSSYLSQNQQTTDDPNQTLLRRHCYHLIPSINLLLSIISGVDYLHSKGIIHRDLKPANIFLSCSEDRHFKECAPCMSQSGACSKFLHPRIGDFGLVADISHLNECSPGTTPTSTPNSIPKLNRVVGTEFYCPPFPRSTGQGPHSTTEQKQYFDYTIDESLDVYALGVILFELIYRINTKMERQMVLTALTRGTQLQARGANGTDTILERTSFPVDFEKKVDCAGMVLPSGETVGVVLKRCIAGMLEVDAVKRWDVTAVRGILEGVVRDVARLG